MKVIFTNNFTRRPTSKLPVTRHLVGSVSKRVVPKFKSLVLKTPQLSTTNQRDRCVVGMLLPRTKEFAELTRDFVDLHRLSND